MKLLNPNLKIDKDWAEWEDTIGGLAETIENLSITLKYKGCTYMFEGYLGGVGFRVNSDKFNLEIPTHDDIFESGLELLTYAKFHDGTPVYTVFLKNQIRQKITYINK